MMNTIEGVYRDGKIELLEPPPEGVNGSVLITFLPGVHRVDLRSRGIDEIQAADLRHRLHTFAEDWDRPEMDVYDEI